jgi:hypothetical protein
MSSPSSVQNPPRVEPAAIAAALVAVAERSFFAYAGPADAAPAADVVVAVNDRPVIIHLRTTA